MVKVNRLSIWIMDPTFKSFRNLLTNQSKSNYKIAPNNYQLNGNRQIGVFEDVGGNLCTIDGIYSIKSNNVDDEQQRFSPRSDKVQTNGNFTTHFMKFFSQYSCGSFESLSCLTPVVCRWERVFQLYYFYFLFYFFT